MVSVLSVPEVKGLDKLAELGEKLEELRVILADAALVESAEEKQYQILEALRILGVEFKSQVVDPGRRPIPSPQSGSRGLW